MRTSPDVEKQILEMYIRGCSHREIRNECKVSGSTIKMVRRRNGISARKRDHWGNKHPRWKGGRDISRKGYVQVWVDPKGPFASMRRKDGKTGEHRMVMAQHLNRPLETYETVHHKNGIRHDNRIENLQLRVGNHGPGTYLVCRRCGSDDLEIKELT